LQCISKLEEMINMAQGQLNDRDFFESQQPRDKNQKRDQNKINKEQNQLANS